MGNVFDIVVCSPFPVPDAVGDGLRDLGFKAADDSAEVWTRLDLKLPVIDGQKVGLEGLCRAIAGLPWRKPGRGHQPWHLRVLWKDDYTMEDDSWGGRVSPYAWQVETWDVTTGAEVPAPRPPHRCHTGSPPPFSHTFICPTGEHEGGWQHPGGPHRMCFECGPVTP